jgi:sugar-specific transcriptional regulator TrmB
MSTQQLLRKVGFSESESTVYMAAIAHGPATAMQLAKQTGLTRQMIYTLLPRLEKEGLMKQVHIGGKRLFAATDPKVLEDRVNIIAQDIRQIIPELQMLQPQQQALATITVYDNPTSIREVYRRFMKDAKSKDLVRLFVTNKVWMKMDPEYLQIFMQFKNKQKIRDHIIAPDTPESRAYAKKMYQPHSEYRFLKNHWETNAEKWIWGDVIAYLTADETTTNLIVIESAVLAAIERSAFDALWEDLPRK